MVELILFLLTRLLQRFFTLAPYVPLSPESLSFAWLTAAGGALESPLSPESSVAGVSLTSRGALGAKLKQWLTPELEQDSLNILGR